MKLFKVKEGQKSMIVFETQTPGFEPIGYYEVWSLEYKIEDKDVLILITDVRQVPRVYYKQGWDKNSRSLQEIVCCKQDALGNIKISVPNVTI